MMIDYLIVLHVRALRWLAAIAKEILFRSVFFQVNVENISFDGNIQ